MKRTYTVVPEDAPEELTAKVKRMVQKDNLGEYLELKFNNRFDSCRVRDINNGQLVAVYDLNYKEDEPETITKETNATAIPTKRSGTGTPKRGGNRNTDDQGQQS